MLNWLPNLIAPYEDELIYSYAERLAINNGFPNIKRFLWAIQKDPLSNKVGTGIIEGVGIFAWLLPLLNNNMRDLVIQECSLYPYHAQFLAPLEQTRIVHILFNSQATEEQKKIFNKKQKIITNTKYCSQCKTEDYDRYGHSYLRRSHQLPKVVVCHKHHSILRWTINDEPVTTKKIKNSFIKLAEFSSSILKANIQTNLWKTQYAINERIDEEPFIKRKIYYVPEKIPLLISSERKYFPYNIRNLMNAYKDTETMKSYLDAITEYNHDTQKLFKLVYDEPYQSLLNNLIPDHVIIQNFILKAKKEYEIFEPFRMTLLQMRHKTCGTVFYTTPAGFLAGMKCPKCTKELN